MDNKRRLSLIDVKTSQDEHSNCVVMTFTFKLKRFPKNMRLLDRMASNIINEMLCFSFYDLGSSSWADCNCKTIQKSIMFIVGDKVVYKNG